MECRNFKELLDSFLCQELAVETNHQLLNHAEHCPNCRAEMASRRNMRESLRRACSHDRLSDEACEQLRTKLRAEASGSVKTIGWRQRWAKVFDLRFAIPIAATAVMLIVAAIAVLPFLKTQTSPVQSLELSETLLSEAASDHHKCAPKFVQATRAAVMPGTVKPEYIGLEKVAAAGAEGLRLHSAHVCAPDGRPFAHLVYTRGEALISLLVTERDKRALKIGDLPSTDVNLAGFQETNRKNLSLGAFQTLKHVILVVSDLPTIENHKLAQTLASPVVEHIRKLDSQSVAALPEYKFDDGLTVLIAKSKQETLRQD
jgi:anti-sigma factor RsiW